MTLQAGLAIRFKGANSDRHAEEFRDSLRGHCTRSGSKLVITKTTRLKVKLCEAVDLSIFRSNGH